MLQAASSVFKREWLQVTRSRGQWMESWIFFLLVSMLVPMIVGEPLKQLPLLSVALIWTSILLATLLTLDKVIRIEFVDGVFDYWLMSNEPLWWLMFIKSWSHWILWILPMIIVSPFVMYVLGLNTQTIPVLFLSLLLGTPVFSFLAIMSASLTLTLRSSGLLLALILVPLALPVIFIGAMPLASHLAGQSASGFYALLGAFSMVCSVLLPHACAFGIKVSSSCG